MRVTLMRMGISQGCKFVLCFGIIVLFGVCSMSVSEIKNRQFQELWCFFKLCENIQSQQQNPPTRILLFA